MGGGRGGVGRLNRHRRRLKAGLTTYAGRIEKVSTLTISLTSDGENMFQSIESSVSGNIPRKDMRRT